MRLGTASRIWHRMGIINHTVEKHQELIEANTARVSMLTDLAEVQQGNMEQLNADDKSLGAVLVSGSEMIETVAGLLVDLMSDVVVIADHVGHPEIVDGIDGRADIAAALMKMQKERRNDDEPGI